MKSVKFEICFQNLKIIISLLLEYIDQSCISRYLIDVCLIKFSTRWFNFVLKLNRSINKLNYMYICIYIMCVCVYYICVCVCVCVFVCVCMCVLVDVWCWCRDEKQGERTGRQWCARSCCSCACACFNNWVCFYACAPECAAVTLDLGQ